MLQREEQRRVEESLDATVFLSRCDCFPLQKEHSLCSAVADAIECI